MTLPFTLYSNRNINNLFTYKTSAAYNALSKTLRHNVRSPFGKRRDDCSTASFGEVKVSALVQIQKDTGTTESTHICCRCSEVAHVVSWIRETGMESQMHGLWIRHDRRGFLLFPPPKTRCFWVQVPFSDLLLQTKNDRHSLMQDQEFGLRLLTLEVKLTHVAQLLEGLVDVPHSQTFPSIVGHPPLTFTLGFLLGTQVLILVDIIWIYAVVLGHSGKSESSARSLQCFPLFLLEWSYYNRKVGGSSPALWSLYCCCVFDPP